MYNLKILLFSINIVEVIYIIVVTGYQIISFIEDLIYLTKMFHGFSCSIHNCLDVCLTIRLCKIKHNFKITIWYLRNWYFSFKERTEPRQWICFWGFIFFLSMSTQLLWYHKSHRSHWTELSLFLTSKLYFPKGNSILVDIKYCKRNKDEVIKKKKKKIRVG